MRRSEFDTGGAAGGDGLHPAHDVLGKGADTAREVANIAEFLSCSFGEQTVLLAQVIRQRQL